MIIKCFCASFLLFLLVALSAHAQNPAQPQQDAEVIKTKSNLVNIDALVKDKKGKYIPDLKLEDFTISENGVVQKVEFFDAPLSRPDTKDSTMTVSAETTPRNYISLLVDYQTTDLRT